MIEQNLSYNFRLRAVIGLVGITSFLIAACAGDPEGSEEPWSGEPWSDEGWGIGDEVTLASGGEAKMPIVIGENTDPSSAIAAEELADYLEQITGASFEVVQDTGAQGIVVGSPQDFEALPMSDIDFGDGVFELEHYAIRSTEDSLYLLGATPLATRFAVWDLLHQLGHRQFFPTDTWEVVPDTPELAVSADMREEPDYFNRQAPRGAMRMDKRPWAEEAWINWQIRNRTLPTFVLSTGHVYDSVITENQQDFDDHPEYWGLANGERNSDAQPNAASEFVQQKFVEFALQRFQDDPALHSVAMDPRDGNYWSESPESLAIGGPSEQAVFLANLVAEAVVEEYGEDKYVGMYGYSHHSPPPTIDVHPNVIVSLATEYIRGGYTFEEMIDGWSARSNMIGVREYYGIGNWHNSLPGHGAKAANTKYLQETIPHYYERGARFLNAESNDAWGGYGLGYYLAARMMWDVDEAEVMDRLIDDFLDKAFGTAKEPMAQFYALIDGSAKDPNVPDQPRPLNDDMVGRMYRHLQDARNLAGDDQKIHARIDDLILYTHYVELFRRYDSIEGPDRQEAFDELVSFAWRTRSTMMAESVELVRDLNGDVKNDENLQWGPGYSKLEPADLHRTHEDEPFSEDAILTILQEGIASHELLNLDFEPWEDSGELEPANFAPDERGQPLDRINRGPLELVLSTDDGVLPEITLSAGHIYDNLGPLQWTLTDEAGELVDHGEVVPNGEDHHFDLSAPGEGIYRFSIVKGSQGFIWSYQPRGARLTMAAGGAHQLERNWYDRLYFYVPEDIEDIFLAGALMEDRYDFVDGSDNIVEKESIEVIQDYIGVPVSPNEDGTVWSLELQGLKADLRFLNIPGYVAFSPDELVLPEEVVDELH